MVNLNVLITRMKGSSASIDKFCNIRKYIPVEEKFKFIKEYDELLKKHIDDYKNYESFIAFIMFNFSESIVIDLIFPSSSFFKETISEESLPRRVEKTASFIISVAWVVPWAFA